MDPHKFNALMAESSPSRLKELNPRPTASVDQSMDLPRQQEPSIPDTLSWGEHHSSNSMPPSLPPIPSQCLIEHACPAPSISSSLQRYLRSFSGNGLDTLRGGNRRRDPLQDVSASGEKQDTSNPNMLSPEEIKVTVEGGRQPLRPVGGFSPDSFRKLSERLSGYSQRLERLENVSFSTSGHDECQEKNDQMDLRVTDLEARVEDVENIIKDSSSQGVAKEVDGSISGTSSTASTNSTARPPAHMTEMFGRLENMQAQLRQLQALSPSCSNPWDIEVVFMPFPLRGIWMQANEFPSQRLSGSTPWTQLPSSDGAAIPFDSRSSQDWAPDGPNTRWLLPRACAPDRLIYKRLRSRGLVRKVAVKGPDARSVKSALSDTFGNLFQEFSCQNSCNRRRLGQGGSHFLGLLEEWVPLRKIHKDSRLRFLSRSEMVTPALWDVNFLSSSVVMKAAAIHRLFVTQPEAYIQGETSFNSRWSWQQIRDMSRQGPNSQDIDEAPISDAREEDCWSWNGRLDEPASPGSSQSQSAPPSQKKQCSSRTSQTFFTGNEYLSTNVSRSGRSGSGQAALRPTEIRRASMPPIAPQRMSIATRRRVVSSGFDQKPSPMHRAMSMAITKRRPTRSPSVRRRNTPSWSVSSPSPALDMGRGITPGHYYATPYSNGPYEPRRGISVCPSHHMLCDYRDGQDRGSATNPDEDTEMGHPRHHHNLGLHDQQGVAEGEDEGDDSDWQGVPRGASRQPEDDPWPGLPDNPISDSENVEPAAEEMMLDQSEDDAGGENGNADNRSDVSSQPSEYPSTQSAWHAGGIGDFEIHEDGDDGDATVQARGVRRMPHDG